MRETKREERAKKKKNKGYHIILEEGKKETGRERGREKEDERETAQKKTRDERENARALEIENVWG